MEHPTSIRYRQTHIAGKNFEKQPLEKDPPRNGEKGKKGLSEVKTGERPLIVKDE